MSKKINKNLKHLTASFWNKNISGSILEGGSRSGKTWSSLDFVMYLCSKVETNATIHILRETYHSFKTSIFDDLKRRLPDYGIFDAPFGRVENINHFNLFGNNIHFLGCDKPSKVLGSGCDYFFANEMIEIKKTIFDAKEQRCRKFWWGDYNPIYSSHWIYDNVLNRPDVSFLHSTLLDNPFISSKERNKILGYEPTAINIKRGTADEYLWNVYGLGKRATLKGQVYHSVEWIKEFPKGVTYFYALDFGYTNDPTALVKIGIDGNNLFIENLIYTPIENPHDLTKLLTKLKVEKYLPIIADRDIPSISVIKDAGFKIKGARKIHIIDGIAMVKKYKLYCVDNFYMRKEQENYRYKEVGDVLLNAPIDDFNHIWDAVRYGVVALNKKKNTFNYQQ